MVLDPKDPTSSAFRQQLDEALARFWRSKSAQLRDTAEDLSMITSVAADFTAGGKRLRPAFAYWGYIASCPTCQSPAELWDLIAAFEVLHAGILIHDDLLDGADTRRGKPTVHRHFEAWHHSHDLPGDAEEFGRSMAVLIGDELLVWSDEMASEAGLDGERWNRARQYWNLVRTEVNSGQILDIWAQYQLHTTGQLTAEERAMKVCEEKTSRYTVQRPAQFGAAAAGAADDLLDVLGKFGLVLGRAFQMRDDLLGVFGDQEQTGKVCSDDLVEGKQTVVLARAMSELSRPKREQLSSLIGKPMTEDQVTLARDLIRSSGAVDIVEEQIGCDYLLALNELESADITDTGRIALTELARQCVQREF